MKSFPILDESSFIKTKMQIHSVAGVIGKFREILVQPIAKNDNLYLMAVEAGFCTPTINGLKELEIGCNLEKLIIEIANNENKYISIQINGQSQNALCGAVLRALSSELGISANVEPDDFNSSEIIQINADSAGEFLIQFINYAELISAFWKRVNGVKTQICLWPHHFDNAFKWFSGRKLDDADEFMNIGVSNGDSTYELPYIYVTFGPPLRKTNTLHIPEGAVLHDVEWTGLVLPYEAVTEKKTSGEQKSLIDNFFDTAFASVQRGFSKR